jgi:hypothetical protein
LEIIQTENEHVLGFMRIHAGKRAVVFANFSEASQKIPARIFEQYSVATKKYLHGISAAAASGDITLEALDLLVFG